MDIFAQIVRQACSSGSVYQIAVPPNVGPPAWFEIRQAIELAARNPPATLTRLEFRMPSGAVIGVQCDRSTDFSQLLALLPPNHRP